MFSIPRLLQWRKYHQPVGKKTGYTPQIVQLVTLTGFLLGFLLS